MYAEDGRSWRFDSPDDFRAWYRSTSDGDWILTHNGGRFDFLWALGCMPEEGWRVRRAGSAIVTARFKRWGTFYDTFRLVPFGLAKWAKKSAWDHKRTRADMPASERDELYEYCLQDCRCLLEAWQDMERRCVELDLRTHSARGQRRLTIGSIAWRTAFEVAEPDAKPHAIPKREYEAARQGLYGGDSQAFRVRAEIGHAFDLNSAYPHALLGPVPVGTPDSLSGRDAARALAQSRPGVYWCSVDVEDRFVPLLPHRVKKQLVWANGRLDGAWTDIELQWARGHGAKIRSVRWGLVYPRSEPYYAPFIERVYEHRERALKASAGHEKACVCYDCVSARWDKFVMNSLYGKLAERSLRDRIAIFSECPGPGWDPIDEAQRHWTKEYNMIPPNARPVQAAYVTARTRIALHERLIRAGKGAIYCDTDGAITITHDPLGVDPTRLGAWKYEGGVADWFAIAPKLATLIQKGEVVVKAKGIPDATPEDILELAVGGTISRAAGVETLRMRLESDDGEFFKKRIHEKSHRRSRKIAGTRYIEKDGTTTALYRTERGEYLWPTTTDKPADLLPHLRASSERLRLRKRH